MGRFKIPCPLNAYILDDAGNPVKCEDAMDLVRWQAAHDVVLAKTQVGAIEVSTVFLVFDHNHNPGRPPVLWETMLFGESTLDTTRMQMRYSTQAEAAAGHEAIVRTLESLGVARARPDTVPQITPETRTRVVDLNDEEN